MDSGFHHLKDTFWTKENASLLTPKIEIMPFSVEKYTISMVHICKQTYVLEAGCTQTLGLLVAGIFHILDLGRLMALVESNANFVSDGHLCCCKT